MYIAVVGGKGRQIYFYGECVTVLHIVCTDSLECGSELYWQ